MGTNYNERRNDTEELTFAEHDQARQNEELDTARQIMSGIDETLKQRGSVYGSFEAQAKCVGSIINDCIICAKDNDQVLDDEQVGCIAYIAIKLSRFAVNPDHLDTTLDLEGYSRLMKEMYHGKSKT